MDELNNITYKAIDYYFKSMETLGYIVKEDLLKIEVANIISKKWLQILLLQMADVIFNVNWN